MAIRNQSNVKFHNEVQEILSHQESSLDQVHATLQTVLSKLQSFHGLQALPITASEINPFAPIASFHQVAKLASSNFLNHHHHLKLTFLYFIREYPTGWIYKAECSLITSFTIDVIPFGGDCSIMA